METLKRIDAARREINTAILMFLNDYDVVATHTVAAAGLQIVSDLTEKDEKIAGLRWLMKYAAPDQQNELNRMFRAPQNFFKHADRHGDDVDTIDYNPDSLESYLLLGCFGYYEYTNTYSPEMRAFLAWYGLNTPETLIDSAEKQRLMEYVRETEGATPTERKAMLLQCITMMRKERPITPYAIEYR